MPWAKQNWERFAPCDIFYRSFQLGTQWVSSFAIFFLRYFNHIITKLSCSYSTIFNSPRLKITYTSSDLSDEFSDHKKCLRIFINPLFVSTNRPNKNDEIWSMDRCLLTFSAWILFYWLNHQNCSQININAHPFC